MYKAKHNMMESHIHTGREAGLPAPLAAALLPLSILYLEILLRLFDRDNDFFTMGLLRTLLFSTAAGLLIWLVLDLLPWRKVSRGLAIGVMAFGTVFTCV